MLRWSVTRSRAGAALAREIHRIARPRDPDTRGLLISPRGAARFVVPKHTPRPLWGSHTLTATVGHHVDALTGTGGTSANDYLEEHWEYPEHLNVQEVDVFEVDPGIQDEL